MQVLLDTCVWSGVREELSEVGHDVIWTGDWPEDPGDAEILSTAYAEGRCLVTLDKDFGELAVAREMPHCGIVRLVGFRARKQGPVCIDVLARCEADLRAGALVTAEPGRIRIRLQSAGDGE